MKRKKIDVLLLRETKVGFTQEVRRTYYTWMFSGSDKESFTHYGVGMVVRNELRGRIIDKEAGGDRMMRIVLQAVRPVEIINIYSPVAKAEYSTDQQLESEKERFYE